MPSIPLKLQVPVCASFAENGTYHWNREETTQEEGVTSFCDQGTISVPLHIIHQCNLMVFISKYEWGRHLSVKLLSRNLSCNVSFSFAVFFIRSELSTVGEHAIWATINATRTRKSHNDKPKVTAGEKGRGSVNSLCEVHMTLYHCSINVM